MTKWEYLSVTFYFNYDLVKAIEINGKEVFKDSKNPINFYDYINQLGKDGWELVNIDVHVYFFKRPLEG